MNDKSTLFRLIVVAVLYYLSGRMGLQLASHASQVTLIWPPTGIAIFALLVWGKNMWLAILVAAFLINVSLSTSLMASFVIAMGNTLGPVIAARVLTDMKFSFDFPSAMSVIRYIFFGAFAGMAINATVGTAVLYVDSVITPDLIASVWLTWWLGDALGVLVFGTALLSIPYFLSIKSIDLHRRETLTVWGVVTILGYLCLMPAKQLDFALSSILTFLPIIWLALRQNSAHAAWAVVWLSLMAIAGVLTATGPFIAADNSVDLMNLWSYLFSLSIISHLITGLRTETDHALKKAVNAEVKLTGIIDSSNDWVWEVDANGSYTYVSPSIEKILGYKVSEIIGKTPFDLMPPAEAQRIAAEFQEIAGQGKPIQQLINTNLSRDGSEVILETNGVPFFNSDGSLAGYRGIDRDVTARIKLENQL